MKKSETATHEALNLQKKRKRGKPHTVTQVIYQTIINETPSKGLIGEKVVPNEKFKKEHFCLLTEIFPKNSRYYIITDVKLEDDGRVMFYITYPDGKNMLYPWINANIFRIYKRGSHE